MIKFFIPMQTIPTATSQEKGINYKTHIVYTKREIQEVKQKYLARLAPHRPAEPLTGPICLMVQFGYPANKKHEAGTWKITKPDTDNAVKLLKDCMTRLGFWLDDAQVAYEVVQKKYLFVPGIFVQVSNLQEVQDENDKM